MITVMARRQGGGIGAAKPSSGKKASMLLLKTALAPFRRPLAWTKGGRDPRQHLKFRSSHGRRAIRIRQVSHTHTAGEPYAHDRRALREWQTSHTRMAGQPYAHGSEPERYDSEPEHYGSRAGTLRLRAGTLRLPSRSATAPSRNAYGSELEHYNSESEHDGSRAGTLRLRAGTLQLRLWWPSLGQPTPPAVPA
jgi:hypothetical protein